MAQERNARQRRYPAVIAGASGPAVAETAAKRGDHHGAVTHVDRQLGIGSESLRLWVHQDDIDRGDGPRGGQKPRFDHAATPSYSWMSPPSRERGDYVFSRTDHWMAEGWMARASAMAPTVAIELAIREGEAEDPLGLLRALPDLVGIGNPDSIMRRGRNTRG